MDTRPVLHFPEFNEKWSLFPLKLCIDFQAGYAFKSTDMTKAGKYQLIKMSNVYMNELRLDRNPSFWGELNSKTSHFLLEKGDMVLTLTGTVGKRDYGYSVTLEKSNQYLLNQRLVRLRAKSKITSSYFVLNLIRNQRFLHKFFSESNGGTGNQSNVSVKDLENIQLFFPNFLEQQKIANFLTSVDTKIQQLKRKHTLMQQYKKGVMQQLFSQQVRFKDDDGRDYPDWEEKRLSDIATFFSGGTPKSTNPTYYGGDIPFIKSGEISAEKTTQFMSDAGFKNSSAKMVAKGDLLYALYGATSGEVAISNINGAINQAVLCITSQEDTVFIFNFLSFSKEKIIQTYLQGGQGNLSAQIIKDITIQLPCISEQKKIADFLKSIDKKVEQLNIQITQAETFKKGLLQQMFV